MEQPQSKENVIDYEDSENWKGGGEQLSIKEISLRRFSKALQEGSKEMVGAGIDRRVINGEVFEIPRPNQRQVFINSVEMAKIPLVPEIKKSKLNEQFKSIEEEIKKLNNEYRTKFENSSKLFIENAPNSWKNDPMKEQGRRREHNTNLQNINEQFEFPREIE